MIAKSDKPRKEKVKPRSKIKNPITGTWTKWDYGPFLDTRADPKPLTGVRKAKDKAAE